MGSQAKSPLSRSPKKTGLILCVSGAICVIGPMLAKRALDNKVQIELANTASASFGVPIHLGEATVGLTGTLEISDIRVGNVFSADSVTASVSPDSKGGKSLAELRIAGPKAEIHVYEDGTTNIDKFLRNSRSPTESQEAGTKTRSSGKIDRIRFVDGSLLLKFINRGQILAGGIDASISGDTAHVIIGETNVDLQHKEWRLEGKIPRSALDYERHGRGLRRFLADGGSLEWQGTQGKAVIQDLMISNQIGEEHWQVRGKTGFREATGSLDLRANPTLEGIEIGLVLEDTPLVLAGPWLPTSVRPEATSISGRIDIKKGDTITADLDISLQKLQIDHKDLSEKTLHMDADVKMHASYHRNLSTHFWDADIDTIQSGELRLSGSGSGQWQGDSLVPELAKLSLALDEVDCARALTSLPSALRPKLAGLELRGTLRSSIDLLMSRSDRDDTSISVSAGIDACRVLREPPGADAQLLSGPYPHQNPAGVTQTLSRESPEFTEISKLPSYLPKAFVAAEDARFFSHDGFDTHQIENSLAIDLKTGRFARGGSTISQQLVKNLFLHRKRSLARKLQEAILTWRLEDRISKTRILELYLNIIELGDDNTYGLTAAAKRWFGIPAKDLSILQSAFLAAMTPEPTTMSARIRAAGGLDPVSKARVHVILGAMKRGKIITKEQYNRAKWQTLHFASSAVASR